ncbi:GM13056 [Drosophila sechellia]|uniref:GM13056 n=1 Tax=Drosophila sechellia TaxID=7238 RepID=B4HYI5_DROSE|nr:GM13056 [Drosophila sechellia]
MNIPIYQVPSVTMQSLHQQSLYQQTYLDRNRMVTDVFVQEHVSQSSWSMAGSSAVFIPGPIITGSTHGHCHHSTTVSTVCPPFAAYMPFPGMQYYAASSGVFFSCFVLRRFYLPQYHASGNHVQPKKIFCAAQTQTQEPVKTSYDVGTQVDLDAEEIRSEARKPKPESVVPEESSISSLESGAGDGLGVQKTLRNSEIKLLEQRLHDITRVSLHGSEIAELLANAHRNRPCFKKIDTLCARLKQDLLRPDGVLPNINSQGIAWAVKDFIFVFTRIVNAWVILKGYVYNTPDALNKIKDELPMGFMASFDSWQVATLSIVKMIIKSFVNLDELLQKQKNSFSGKDGAPINQSNSISLKSFIDSNDSSGLGQKYQGMTTGHGPSAFSTPHTQIRNADSKDQEPTSSALYKPKCALNLNYLYTMIEDSEETQRHVDANGTYLKTGTYQPLQKESKPLEMPPAKPMEPIATQKALSSQEIPNASTPKSSPQSERPRDVRAYTNPFSAIGKEITRQLYEFSDRVMELKNLERFFKKQFTRNYHCQDDFIDVRAIIMRCENSTYHHIYQAIHDLRRIIFTVRCYLQMYTDENLLHYIDLYERSVNDMLSKPPHYPNQFDHIMGRPGEKLFNYEI